MSIEQIISTIALICAIGELFFAEPTNANLMRGLMFVGIALVGELSSVGKYLKTYVAITLGDAEGAPIKETKKKKEKSPIGFSPAVDKEQRTN